ncbi:hypothetical protein F5Y15DRAFT_428945 [Xylariaceae sp. FL0016]|nr:hypothetical protein F5Y15DRAFT_428945 [Xylariaceae sp. FL0016]
MSRSNKRQRVDDHERSLWKTQTTAKIEQLNDVIEQLLQHNNLPGLAKHERPVLGASERNAARSSTSHSDGTAPGTGNFTAEGVSADLEEDDSDLVPLPMNNLYSLTDASSSRLIRVDPAHVNGPDFISRGVVTLAEAEYLFNHYRDRINPLLWDGILCQHKSLNEARQSSSLLVATALTVAALHIPNREQSLHATYDAFVSLMRASCLLHTQNLDDIRGLCIGAFYLTSLSWALSSRAVRVATEMNLHKASLPLARAPLASVERVRLWYVLYVCDHQFALAYGRPPLMHEDSAIRSADKLLASGLASRGDRALVAQVKLFRILAGAYFMYGCDPDLELGDQDYEMLQSFNVSVDQWRLEQQQTRTADAAAESSMPSKGTALYYHLAKFQLNSMSLRGISARGAAQDLSGLCMSWDRQEAANSAISAATSTVRLIVQDPTLRASLIGTPIFTHAMIAVCASFLLKMAVVSGTPDTTSSSPPQAGRLRLPRDLAQHGLNFHTRNALDVVAGLVRALARVAEDASQRHVVRQAVTGLRALLQRFSEDPDPGRPGALVYARGGDAGAGGGGSSNNEAAPEAAGRVTVPATQGDALGERGMIANRDVAQGRDGSHGGGRGSCEGAVFASWASQQDPFDLMGDLDWRFDDGFLWGMDSEMPSI